MHEYFIICGILVEEKNGLYKKRMFWFFLVFSQVKKSRKEIKKCKMRN